MSETKTCPHCGKVFNRPAESLDFNWNRRRFCAEACARAALIAKAKSGNKTPYKASNSPITRDEAERFVALLNDGVGMTEATMRVGRANGGRMMLAAIKHGLMEPPPPPQPEPEPKPKRIEPLAAGADETWGAMMPDLNWADAQRQIANMRAY
ncbi:hypothetical protein [Asaia prunellae]|uniref:hypothetical protein n=1 Tax=Asaia prunellae TaxID=610245 RepID=UPI00046FF9C4|nr:hypothetical protein [Asaia prunellae]